MRNVDILSELGALAVGSRLRRLSERMWQDVTLIYREQDIDFEARWFPLFSLLARTSPLSIMDIATTLGVSHPAVNQIAAEMMKHDLVCALKDDSDKRKRLLALTDKGRAMMPTLERIWADIDTAVKELLSVTEADVLAVLGQLERALDDRNLYARFLFHQELSAAQAEPPQPAPKAAKREKSRSKAEIN